MNWFLVVYFLVNGIWVEADTIDKEGWSSVIQPNYDICEKKIDEANARFTKIAEFKNIELDIMFKCECKTNIKKPDLINCKERNWFQKIWDAL